MQESQYFLVSLSQCHKFKWNDEHPNTTHQNIVYHCVEGLMLGRYYIVSRHLIIYCRWHIWELRTLLAGVTPIVTKAHHYNIIHQFYTAVLYSSVIHQCYTVLLYINVIQQCYTAVIYSSVIKQCYTLVIYSSFIQQCYTAKLYSSVIQQYYTSVLYVIHQCHTVVLYSGVIQQC